MKILYYLQYNALSRVYLKVLENMVPLTSRLKCMLFDFALCTMAMSILIPFVAVEKFTLNTEFTANVVLPIFFVIVVSMKDSIDGRSIGKRLVGYVVVDSGTGETASVFQCVIRNLTFLIWPIEALLLLGTPEYRVGDFLARTKVITCEPSDPKEMIKGL